MSPAATIERMYERPRTAATAGGWPTRLERADMEQLTLGLFAPPDPAPGERLNADQARQLRDLGFKRCLPSGCSKVLPISSFGVGKSQTDGLQSTCKDCLARRWRAFYEENREAERERCREYYKTIADDVCRRTREYQKNNPDIVLKQKRAWRKSNAEKVRLYARRYRALVRDAPVNDLTEDQVADVWAEYNGICYIPGCGAEAKELDHIVPLSGGGGNTKSNVAPACVNCNRSKGAKPLDEWLATRTKGQA